MNMADFLWPTIGMVVLFVVVIGGIIFMRKSERKNEDSIRSARQRTQSKDITMYIQQLKQKDHEAWSQVMTVMKDEERGVQTAFMNQDGRSPRVGGGGDSFDAPLSELQIVFFSFWKIPANKIPSTQGAANRFIEAYKAKLKSGGYEHRVRRWGRLEVLMERFYSDFNVEDLNGKCEQLGMHRTILEMVLAQTMNLLSRKVLAWRGVGTESAYQLVIKTLDNAHPKLELNQYKRG